MESDEYPLETVNERDVDLILLEEFHTSEAFRTYFLENFSLGSLKFKYAWHSVTYPSLGESDLVVDFYDGSEVVRFLIENKIDAPEQFEQQERYQERGKEHANAGECDRFYSVLICPEKYVDDEESKNYDRLIYYEGIMEWFSENGKYYRKKVFEQAIDKSKRGYQKIEDPNVMEFWKKYYELANDLAPELEMKEPGKKGSKSGFIYFKPSALDDSKSSLVHKTFHGAKVDLQISGLGKKIEEISNVLKGKLEKDMFVSRAKKSASISISVPKVDPGEDFDEQKVSKAINSAKKLLELWKDVKDLQELKAVLE